MTFEEVVNLGLFGKRIYLKKGNNYYKLFISGIIKHHDDFYFVTKSTVVNDDNESVVRQVKVDSIVSGLSTGKYFNHLPQGVIVKPSKKLSQTNNSYYHKGFHAGYIDEEDTFNQVD